MHVTSKDLQQRRQSSKKNYGNYFLFFTFCVSCSHLVPGFFIPNSVHTIKCLWGISSRFIVHSSIEQYVIFCLGFFILIMSPSELYGGHVFGADPVGVGIGVGVSVTLSCLHDIS